MWAWRGEDASAVRPPWVKSKASPEAAVLDFRDFLAVTEKDLHSKLVWRIAC
jgi:hypothetical protein